jgi:hypothetical protein
VVTIGVYGWDLSSFLQALAGADVRLLIDLRQRRGVRGLEYAWANAARLQAALAGAGVAYEHHKELAPRPNCDTFSTPRTRVEARASGRRPPRGRVRRTGEPSAAMN